jgi:hypothetical protein
MPLQKGILVSFGERKTSHILDKWEPYFKICRKVRFFDVFTWGTEATSRKEREFLEKTHFDFLVASKEPPHKPLFVVDFDGFSETGFDPFRDIKLAAKQRICEEHGLPFLWISYDEIKDLPYGESILDWIIDCYFCNEAWSKIYSETPENFYVHDFMPFLNLLSKFFRLADLYKITLKFEKLDVVETQEDKGPGYIQASMVLWIGKRDEFRLLKIEKTARVKAFKFPYFDYYSFAGNLAQYHCLLEGDRFIKNGYLFKKLNIIPDREIIEWWRSK